MRNIAQDYLDEARAKSGRNRPSIFNSVKQPTSFDFNYKHPSTTQWAVMNDKTPDFVPSASTESGNDTSEFQDGEYTPAANLSKVETSDNVETKKPSLWKSILSVALPAVAGLATGAGPAGLLYGGLAGLTGLSKGNERDEEMAMKERLTNRDLDQKLAYYKDSLAQRDQESTDRWNLGQASLDAKRDIVGAKSEDQLAQEKSLMESLVSEYKANPDGLTATQKAKLKYLLQKYK